MDNLDGGATADASADAKPKKDSGADADAGTVYVPIGKKCDPPDASAPLAWTPDDAGAALRPPLVASSGGKVLADPTFVAMTFDGDDMRDPIEDFISSVGCTSYWRSIVTDYGVNDAYALAPSHMADKAPTAIDDSQIAVFIRQKILTKAVPDAVQNKTLYVIFYPDTTDITLQGSHSCQSFGGYHNELQMQDGRVVPYAVIPRCNGFGQLGGLDALTAPTSHELMEAVSDPFPMTSPAYQFPEPNGLAWGLIGGGEIGDMCEFDDDAFFAPSDYPFYVQHQWTNSSAFLAHNPCQPNKSTYVAAIPILPDVIPFDFGAGAQTTTGVKLGLNQTTSIDVKIVSDAAWTSTVTLSAHDAAQFLGGGQALNVSISPQQAHVGDTVKLTITRLGTNKQFGLEPFELRATSQGSTRLWWALVGDP